MINNVEEKIREALAILEDKDANHCVVLYYDAGGGYKITHTQLGVGVIPEESWKKGKYIRISGWDSTSYLDDTEYEIEEARDNARDDLLADLVEEYLEKAKEIFGIE